MRLSLVFVVAAMVTLAGCASDEERTAEHSARAEAYLEDGKPREALLELRNALKLRPQDAEINYQIARVVHEMRDLNDAAFFYEETLRLVPEHADAALQLAGLLLVSELERSQELIEGVLARDPDNSQAYGVQSELELVSGDAGAAYAAALAALERAPEDPRSFMQLGKVRRAQIRERKLRKQPPDDLLFEAGIEAFERAIELMDADDRKMRGKAWRERSKVFSSQDLGDDTLAAVREAAEAGLLEEPPDVVSVRGAAELAQRAGNLELEHWALERVVEVEPRAFRFWRRLATVSEKIDEGGAAQVLERLLALEPDAVGAFLVAADTWIALGRPEDAIAALEAAVQQAADPLPAYAALAEIHFNQGDHDESRSVLEALESDFPGRLETKLVSARLALEEARYPAAATELRQVVQEKDDHMPAYRLLAEAELKLGEAAAAQQSMKTADDLGTGGLAPVRWIRLRSRIEAANVEWNNVVRIMTLLNKRLEGKLLPADRVVLARALYGTGKPQPAKNQLTQVLELESPPPGAAVLFAQHEGRRDPAGARKALNAAAGEGSDWRLIRELARLELEQGDVEAAIARIDAALDEIELDFGRAQLLLMRARLLGGQGELDRAVADAEKALEIDPSARSGIRVLVGLLQAQGRGDQALAELKEAREEGHLSKRGHALLARLLMERGNVEEAKPILEELVAKDASPGLRNDLAYVITVTGGDKRRALELAQSARADDPESAAIADTLGFVYLELGMVEAAADQFRSALDLEAEGSALWSSAQFRLGLALKAQGREEDAFHAVEMALATGTDFPEADAARQELAALAEAERPELP